jgi:hypothetical protein
MVLIQISNKLGICNTEYSIVEVQLICIYSFGKIHKMSFLTQNLPTTRSENGNILALSDRKRILINNLKESMTRANRSHPNTTIKEKREVQILRHLSR